MTEPLTEPLTVPWTVLPDYRCFGCSPRNPHGLQLRFWAHPDGLMSAFRPGRGFESYPGVVHGGVISTVCDETMGNLLVLRGGRSAFTVNLRLRYLSPLAVDREYHCVARMRTAQGDPELLHTAADVLDEHGTLLVTATGSYQPVSMQRAREHLILTDEEAALLETSLPGQPNGAVT
jgi:acyl-coenzyme A thioesterase PaaI-like protein